VQIYVNYSKLLRKNDGTFCGHFKLVRLCVLGLRGTIECPTCAPPSHMRIRRLLLVNYPITCTRTDSDDLVRGSYICGATGHHCHGKSHYPKDPSLLVSTPLLA